MVLQDKVVVVNKFYPFEAQVNTLIEVLKTIPVEEDRLDKEQRTLLAKLRQTELDL